MIYSRTGSVFFYLSLTLTACGIKQDQPASLLASVPGLFEHEEPRSARRTGEYEGYIAINSLLRERVLDSSHETTGRFNIESIGGVGVMLARNLLGEYDTLSEVSEFTGGEPNPFNTMLWYNQLSTLSRSIGRTCKLADPGQGQLQMKLVVPDFDTGDYFEVDVSFQLQAEIAAIMPQLCAWKAGSPEPRRELEILWEQVLSYDAPFAEREAWIEFFLKADPNDPLAGEERVAALFETMFMNPFFILME